jgi:hypothetical protein
MDKIFIFFQSKDIVSVSVQTDIGVIVFTVIAYKNIFISSMDSGADPGFKFSGAHLKKLRQAEGGAKIVGVFHFHFFSNEQIHLLTIYKLRAPPKIGKNKIFWRKIVIFHTKYPNNFRASLRHWKTYDFLAYFF